MLCKVGFILSIQTPISSRTAINDPQHREKHAARYRKAFTRLGTVCARPQSQALRILQRILVLLEDALFHKLLGIWSALKALLKAVSPHVVFELSLLLLQSRCSVRGREDVALNEVFAVRTSIEALLEVVSGALALELEGFGLECSAVWSAEDAHGMNWC